MKDGKPYAFAGLWEQWKDRKAGIELLTFTVITTDPNEVVERLHDRMPCIIPEKDYDRWLQPGDPDRPPIDLLRPFDADKMTAWRVDKAVGNVKNDSPELIEPASVHAQSGGRWHRQKSRAALLVNPTSETKFNTASIARMDQGSLGCNHGR